MLINVDANVRLIYQLARIPSAVPRGIARLAFALHGRGCIELLARKDRALNATYVVIGGRRRFRVIYTKRGGELPVSLARAISRWWLVERRGMGDVPDATVNRLAIALLLPTPAMHACRLIGLGPREIARLFAVPKRVVDARARTVFSRLASGRPASIVRPITRPRIAPPA